MAKRKRDIIEKSEEALSAPVNPSGAGEDPVVHDLLKGKMATATDTEALDMALALRQIIRGQELTLEQLNKQQEQINLLREQAARRDLAARKFEEDSQKYMEDVLSRAEKLRVKGDELDKLKANAANETSKIYQEALAKAKVDRAQFEQSLARMPKVTVVSGGVAILTSEAGRPAAKLMPEEVRIKHKVWILPPGQPVEVPAIVAQVLSDRRKGQQQTHRLETALQSDLEAPELAKKIAEIRKDEAPYDPNQAQSPI